MGELSPWHLLIVAAVFVVLFGAKKLPDAARSLGQSMRIFKAETRGLIGDHEHDADHAAVTTPHVATPVAPVIPVLPSVVEPPAPVTVPGETSRS